MNFKKKVSGSWTDVPHYISGTDTETITTLPATIYPLAQSVTISLKGNTVQSGTPSPSNPVDVDGTGDRTNILQNAVIIDNTTISENGNYGDWVGYSGDGKTVQIPCETNAKYYLELPSDYTSFVRIYCANTDDIPTTGEQIRISKIVRDTSPTAHIYEFTTTANAKNIILQFSASQTASVINNSVLSRGYKIPISNGQQTTNIYLGSTQTTRRIKKLVLTGKEDWEEVADAISYPPYFRLPIGANGSIIAEMIISSHYEQIFVASPNSNNGIDIANSSVANASILKIRDTNTFTDMATLKAYLAAQYAAGTPVTVWYVISSATTGIVNEPLMKIGNYADTLSNAASIPITEGANSITVDTTVQPSEVTVNYKGWHPVADVHERDSGQWT